MKWLGGFRFWSPRSAMSGETLRDAQGVVSRTLGAVLLGTFCLSEIAVAQFDVMHPFEGSPNDGAEPRGGLVQGSDGNFYGTTARGGTNGYGTVFRMTASGALTILHSFSRSDGDGPYNALLRASDGNFYGTTGQFGPEGGGTVFRLEPSGVVTTVHAFGLSGGGSGPECALIQASDGNLYGTTVYSDGPSAAGTLFRLSLSGDFTTLHEFDWETEGANPFAGLIEGSDGNFYGTTGFGGANGCGTVFRMSPLGSVEALHHFSGCYDLGPIPSGLVEGSDGNLYGVTALTGSSGVGEAYRVSSSGLVTVLHSFVGAEGIFPQGTLIEGSDGNLYGTTWSDGKIFRMTPSGAITILHSFGSGDGHFSFAALLESDDGYLYGANSAGGASGGGTIFRLSTANSATATGNESVNVSTAPQMPGRAGINATLTSNATGTATITAQNFPSDPGTAGIIDVGGKYVDLKVTGADLGDTVNASFYYPTTVTGSNETNLQLFYFTGSAWAVVRSSGGLEPVKSMTDNLDATVSGGRFAVLFDATSTPKVTELTGTVFTSSVAVSYGVCLLYDPTKAHKSGSTIPIKLQLCDGARNLSASDVPVSALELVRVSSNISGSIEDSGRANPDSDFRYDSSLGGSGGYIFNLSTRGYATGTYQVRFRGGADQVIHIAEFQVR